MKRKFLLCAAVVVLALTTTSTSFASLRTIEAGDKIKIYYNSTRVPYRSGNGGEFVVDRDAGGVGSYQLDYTHTFCAENNEYIYDGEEVLVQSVGLTTLEQGNTLTAGAAKLFREYTEGIAANSYGFPPGLSNFTLTTGATGAGTFTFRLGGTDAQRAADGESVQKALWYMIGATSTVSGDAAALVAYYGNSANFSGSGDGNYYGVRFANLIGSTIKNGTYDRQDQFILTVPEPGSVLIWTALIGMAGFGSFRRRNTV